MSTHMNINDLISGQGFIMVNKGLAKEFGLVAATLYGELVSTYQYWKNRDMLTIVDNTEWFFCSIEDLEDKTTIKKDAQSKAIKLLEKEGLLKTKRMGLPAKRYFHITDKYVEILVGNYFSEKPKTDNTNGSEGENGEEARPNQISEKPKTGLRDNRKQDFCKTATNNKVFNNKQLIKEEEEENIINKENQNIVSKESIKDIECFLVNEGMYDKLMVNRIVEEMNVVGLEFLTIKEMKDQAKRMELAKDGGKKTIFAWAKYFVGGIAMNRISTHQAIVEEKLRLDAEKTKRKKEMPAVKELPLYNWLEN